MTQAGVEYELRKQGKKGINELIIIAFDEEECLSSDSDDDVKIIEVKAASTPTEQTWKKSRKTSQEPEAVQMPSTSGISIPKTGMDLPGPSSSHAQAGQMPSSCRRRTGSEELPGPSRENPREEVPGAAREPPQQELPYVSWERRQEIIARATELAVNFLILLYDLLRCTQCSHHLRHGPIRMLDSGNNLCHRCLRNTFQFINFNNLRVPIQPGSPNSSIEIILSVVLGCPYFIRGCAESFPLCSMFEHVRKCIFRV
ncbi:hypothetical protein C0J52_15455 [Blattella germanica]|nr:hypothetical protein C0J52_15455 [Blattella germanica]PSN36975.1 hypothetical protein C0J52_15455 [Blattella germanica]